MSDDVLSRLTSALEGRYRIERELDRGGMAIVYLAEDLRHHRRVAIKVLQPVVSQTVGTDRFLREVEVIARLQHPHILTLIDSGEADGLPYYVMPFVAGESLRRRLEAGPLDVEEAVRIALEIADALAYAHEQGIIHRDVKPANVLLSEGHAVVADFGIAGALEYAATARLTQTGTSLGSPAYMSPEQAAGDREVDRRSDLYSLGCVLFEMLAGQSPFAGLTLQALLGRKVLGEVPPLRELRPDVPRVLARVIGKAMATSPEDRFQDASQLSQALREAVEGETVDPRARARRRIILGVLGVVGVAAVVLLGLALHRSRQEGERAVWATQQIAEVERLTDVGELAAAFVLAAEVAEVLPEDTALNKLWDRVSWTAPINSEPAGARVYRQHHEAPEDRWDFLGVTPLEGVRFIEGEGYRVRLELGGHRPVELLQTAIRAAEWRNVEPMDPVRMDPVDVLPEGMVRIPLDEVAQDSLEYGDFFLDRYEVTSSEYQRFVDAGGYGDPSYWSEPFVRGGLEIPWEEAVASFEDRTGRPGPATWAVGRYPEGQGDYPVSGVSWYEAAAYARFVGKELPTAAHWNQGRRFYREDSWLVVPRSNLGGEGPRPVGENRAMTTLGIYDMAGNVREWLVNPAPEGQRGTRGGAWTDAPFHVGWIIPKSPWDRDPTHGFRLMRTFDEEDATEFQRQRRVAATERPDYRDATPAPDGEFAIYRRLYEYEPLSLNASVEEVDTAEHWIVERVRFDLPYGERGGADLFIPRHVQPPYESVLFWPGSGYLDVTDPWQVFGPAFDFIVRGGRVVAVPVFRGSLWRDPGNEHTWGSMTANMGSPGFRETRIRWMQDFSRTVDYLVERADMDEGAIGFYGHSWGGLEAPVALVVEPRIGAAVLNVGGFWRRRPLPEVDPFNFAPRVQTPVLMLNGEYDIVFPLETTQKPMFELLGTPPEHKKHHVTPASHLVPRDELIRETLDWFDRYLGEPGR